jgi:hypothetical protein
MVNYDQLPAASRFFDGKLYQTMRDDLQLAGMSKRTVHGYLRAIRQLADYCSMVRTTWPCVCGHPV